MIFLIYMIKFEIVEFDILNYINVQDKRKRKSSREKLSF
jgi:hypothetical protein